MDVGFGGCIASSRRALGLVVAVLVVGSGVGLLSSSGSAAASKQKRPAVRGGRHVIRGGPGNVVLRGRRGNDIIYGGRGNDRIYGGRGNDRIYGGRGNDRIYGDPGNDRIDGGAGNDVIHGGRGKDVIHGGRGNDRIYGGPGKEVIYGGRGNDRIIAERGATTVFPGSGTNRVDVADGRRNDRVVCAAGSINHITADRGDRIARSCLGNGSTVSTGGGVSPETWMHDLAGYLQDQKLSDIVFPGSHDTGTYILPNDPISLIGKAQTEDITSQLNDGIRELDLRVAYDSWCVPAGFYLVHGVLASCSLSLSDMIKQIEQWTTAPGHEHEIILVGLSIGPGPQVDPYPTDACAALAEALPGGALLTPYALKDAYGTDDPGKVTPGQLWAMPGHPRVILNNSQCIDAGYADDAGQWNPDPPFGSGPGQNYFADQCYADPYSGADFSYLPGIKGMVLSAAQLRSIQGGGDDNGHETNLGPPMVGGLWTLYVQATPNADCLKPLRDFDLVEQENALAALYQEWHTNPNIKANVNIVSGDFVQDSALFRDVIAMDESKFPVADSIVTTGSQQVSAEENSNFYDKFFAYASANGQPVTGVPVTYKISPFDGNHSPHFWQDHGDTVVTTSGVGGEVDVPSQHAVLAGDTSGTWTLTASARGAAAPATWKLTVVEKPKKVITLQALHTPGTVQVGSTVQFPSNFQARAVDQTGTPVAGVNMTFDATGIGTFDTGQGPQPTFLQSTGPDGVAGTSAFTAGTRAGAWAISVHSADAVNTVSLPITITPGPPAVVTAASGDRQQTGRGQPFPEPLAVTVTDQWHNPITGTPVTFKVTSGDAAFTSVNSRRAGERTANPAVPRGADLPQDSVTVSTDDHAVATAPMLTAGPTAGPIVVTASADRAASTVKAAVFSLSAVKIAPTPPSITTLQNGDGQVAVGFSGAVDGTSPITFYKVSAVDKLHPTAAPATATGSASPITVNGLTNGDPYVFTVTATSADGTSPPSAPTNPLNVGVVPMIQSGPANASVGKPYSSGFTVTGAPPPSVTLVSGDLPPGLTLSSDGKLTGTPTKAGTYTFTVRADNHVGIDYATVPVTISPATLGGPPAAGTGRRLNARICTSSPKRRKQTPVCFARTLIGTFPPLATNATATLVRGSIIYAAGHATARYRKLSFYRRLRLPAGQYTLILRHRHRAIIAAVVLR
jgi:hypothetical protein